jgi:Asp-tRNA(Asn)/Glu-tRNA(Gln) amidotransferase C subunit
MRTKSSARLGQVLGYIEKLREVDVAGRNLTAHAVPMSMSPARMKFSRFDLNDDALPNAPAHAPNGLFVVPKRRIRWAAKRCQTTGH